VRIGPVTRFVAVAHGAAALCMVVPAILAIGSQVVEPGHYVLGILASLTIGGLTFALGQGMTDRRVVRGGFRELLLGLIVFWAVVPCSASVPFLAGGMSIGEAWFETVSALTTTGGWLSDPAARATDAGMLYRASLQWLGGLVSLATAAAAFVRPEFIGVAPLVPPFARGESGSYLRAFDRAAWTFLPVYAGLTILGVVAFLLTGVAPVEALTMSLSFLATGGFVPDAGGMASYSVATNIVAAILMSLGAVNFIVIAGIALGRAGRMRQTRDRETIAFVLVSIAIMLMYWVATGAGDLDRLPRQLFNAISILSTNGQILGEGPPLTPVLVTAIIGGAAVSTAGGIKLLRWLITIRRTGEELWRLTNPTAVRGQAPTVNELGIWIHTLAFTLLLAVMVLTTAFFGYSLEISGATAVAVIANSGPLLDLAPNMTADFLVFEPFLRLIFGIGMIAGRLELVVLLVIISRRFWQG
jgi:trk system potassium uptake protein TrkH